MNNYTPTVLTIAGLDPYGGAGVQVDSKTIHALGCYAFLVPTALTAQSSTGVKSLLSTDLNIFKEQLTVLLDDVKVDALKLGMLANEDIVSIVVEIIDKYELKNIVLDTVLVSSSGRELLSAKAKELMVKELFPRVDLITPNLPEINTFLNASFVGKSSEVENIANAFFALGVKNILIKGGHSLDKNRATDYLVSNPFEVSSFSSPRVETTHTHGTGCILSSAIATGLAKNFSLEKSVEMAKDFLTQKLQNSSSINFNYVDETLLRKEAIF